ncbi:Txe/YoeB family addiction module toxin [Synergistaceae bacterium OttesenSCG-928-D05]|nr:Txe/YoeB family addiction module toxin [Synergistaceae bacterium OttesenSCG-928-D05]
MRKIWSGKSWDEYLYWQKQDKKTVSKINKLIKSIERDGELQGEGKPERLKEDLSGWCSRRIDDKNRLIYRVISDSIEIAKCGDHYNGK